MNRLIEGVRRFRREVFPHKRELFDRLNEGQQPDTLFIGCSDSRVSPHLITSSEPGNLFEARNPGNIVPLPGGRGDGTAAAVDYAVTFLRVANVVLCGHYGCGAVRCLAERPANLSEQMSEVASWLMVSHEGQENAFEPRPGETHKAMVQRHTLMQYIKLLQYPSIRDGLKSGNLSVGCWVYSIGDGCVFEYDEEAGLFVPLREPDGE